MTETNKTAKSHRKTPAVAVGRARKTGDIEALKRIHWIAVRTAYRLMKGASTHAEQLSAVHAINQASGSYVKLLEQSDLKAELAQLRQELAELRTAEGLRKVV